MDLNRTAVAKTCEHGAALFVRPNAWVKPPPADGSGYEITTTPTVGLNELLALCLSMLTIW